ncbi:hypothetical protein PVL29_010852 [Vitis rotundifolia]|uniref:Uncharacterized protein n=1 Tax=Vitis rotundifolia TaxID=103349 RepID=A0AA39DU17_VITRO|nr:hypothetical protein PVL29_010852 [Vitis rotundifolia]
MNALFFSSSPLLATPSQKAPPFIPLRHHFYSHYSSYYCGNYPSFPLLSSSIHRLTVGAATPSNEGAVSVIDFEDFMEKDWSFLDSDSTNSEEEHKQKTDWIISKGNIGENSRVLVSTGAEEFVDQLVDSSPCQLLLVVHDSLFVLAGIKEKYDKVKCWQGELIYVPEKWTPFDVVFLYFLPALPFELDRIFGELAKRCLPGARVVISHLQGREVLEQQRRQYPDVIISDLPDKMTLQKVAADHSFEMTEFVEEPGFYLAVLNFCEVKNSKD